MVKEEIIFGGCKGKAGFKERVKETMKNKRLILTWVIILAIALSGVFIGRLSIGSMRAEGESYEYLKVFTEVLLLLRRIMWKR